MVSWWEIFLCNMCYLNKHADHGSFSLIGEWAGLPYDLSATCGVHGTLQNCWNPATPSAF